MPHTWKDIFINVDLHATASIYLDKLDKWKEFAKAAAAGRRLTRVVRRYENLWLPMLASCSVDEEFEPPDDVHWMWHLHQLLADSYSRYWHGTDSIWHEGTPPFTNGWARQHRV